MLPKNYTQVALLRLFDANRHLLLTSFRINSKASSSRSNSRRFNNATWKWSSQTITQPQIKGWANIRANQYTSLCFRARKILTFSHPLTKRNRLQIWIKVPLPATRYMVSNRTRYTMGHPISAVRPWCCWIRRISSNKRRARAKIRRRSWTWALEGKNFIRIAICKLPTERREVSIQPTMMSLT